MVSDRPRPVFLSREGRIAAGLFTGTAGSVLCVLLFKYDPFEKLGTVEIGFPGPDRPPRQEMGEKSNESKTE